MKYLSKVIIKVNVPSICKRGQLGHVREFPYTGDARFALVEFCDPLAGENYYPFKLDEIAIFNGSIWSRIRRLVMLIVGI